MSHTPVFSSRFYFKQCSCRESLSHDILPGIGQTIIAGSRRNAQQIFVCRKAGDSSRLAMTRSACRALIRQTEQMRACHELVCDGRNQSDIQEEAIPETGLQLERPSNDQTGLFEASGKRQCDGVKEI
jgi:hypothetical protein